MQATADPVLVAQIGEAFRGWRQPLENEQADQLAVYLALLERWNGKVNLTSIRDREQAILRHFVEPSMARSLLGGAGPLILDAGSGGGFPGLPFKIFDAERDCLLVEANGKKATFLKEVVDALELEGVTIFEGRFEELIAEGRLQEIVSAGNELGGGVHLLTARAWSGWAGLLGLGATLMVPGGRAVIFVGEETLRALRRYLGGGPGAPPTKNPEWSPAARAGWRVRRIVPLPHLDRGYAVSLELPPE